MESTASVDHFGCRVFCSIISGSRSGTGHFGWLPTFVRDFRRFQHVPYPHNYSDDLSIHLNAPATVVPGLGRQGQVASQFTLQAGLWYYWLLGDSDKVTPYFQKINESGTPQLKQSQTALPSGNPDLRKGPGNDKGTLAAEPPDLSSVSMRHEPPTEAVRVELEVP